MYSGLERDVKKTVKPYMTSECWSPVVCCLLSTGYKHLTNNYNKFTCVVYVIMQMQTKLYGFILSKSYYRHLK